jgi:hypothetical protein
LQNIVDMLGPLMAVLFSIAPGLVQGDAKVKVFRSAVVRMYQDLGIGAMVQWWLDPVHLFDPDRAYRLM